MKLIKQFDETDCGAACIAMIANSHGSHFTITEIREKAGTDRHGTNLNGIVLCSKAIGFETKALKTEKKEIDSDLPVPFIAHLKKDNGMLHFVVVYKVKKNILYIADPAKNKYKTTLEEFKKEWSGYAVFLNPTPDFKPKGEKRNFILSFIPLLKPHLKTIGQAMLASVILNVLGIVGSFYFGYIVDTVLPSQANTTLHILSIGMLFLTFFQVVLGVIRNHILLHFSIKTSLALNFSYLKHVLSLPISFFDTRKVGEILSRLDDGAKVRGLLSEAALSVLIDIGMMLIAGVFLAIKSWKLFLIALISVPFSTAVIWGFAKFFRENYKKQMSEGADTQSFLVETMNGMGTVKGLNASDKAFDELEKKMVKVNNTAYKGAVAGNIQGVLTGLIDGFGSNILLWIGSYFILGNYLSLGGLIAFNSILGYFLGPLKRLLGMQTAIQEALVAGERLLEIMECEPEQIENKKLLSPSKFCGNFKFSDITFRYGKKRPVIENLNLEIEAGTKIAFVGSSGCGKSTLIKIMLKFYEAESGEVLLDENNMKDLEISNLRNHIGYVPQDVFLFSGSIMENITIHKPDATMEEVVEAAKRAQAHDFINEMSERYDTILSERGSSLSGGERQRLALARALLGKPDILIFDEATSNLDVITEKAVHETIRQLANEGLTTIIVAHRLSTVVSCDKIYVMDKGKIVESGNHYELVKRGGAYTKLWEYQKL